MSRKSQLARVAKNLQREKAAEQRITDLVQDATAVITCLTEATDDFAYQCERHIGDFQLDLALARLAREIWSGRPGPAEQLVQTLNDLVQEHERHQQVLTDIQARFESLVATISDEENHQHLDPPEAYRERVRKCFIPDLPSPT